MANSMLICSGYSAPEGNDILAVRVNEKGETEISGGIRQGDNPSFCLIHGDSLYSVSEREGEAFIYTRAIGRTGMRESPDGSGAPETGEKRMRVPGGELCHLYAGDRALYGSCYGTGDFFAVDYDLTEILWHRKPENSARMSGPADSRAGKDRERQASPHAHWTTERDGILYLSDLGSDRIYRYRMQDGLPGEELEALCLDNGAGPRQVLPVGGKDRILSVQELDGTLCLWERRTEEADAMPDTGDRLRMDCVQKVRTTAFEGENYPGTICMADESTVLVCNRGANTVAAFSLEDEELVFIGEWPTGKWPRYICKIPGTNLFANACNEEGVVVIFTWRGGTLQKAGGIVLHGASCAAAR